LNTTLDYNLLPKDKTFGQLIFPYALPYFAYVGIGGLLSGLMPIEVVGALKILVVSALLWIFRKEYHLGPNLTARQIPIAIGAGVIATLLWIVALRFSLALPFWKSQLAVSDTLAPSHWQWILRAIGSILLVPIFEELLCRAYLGEYFFNVPKGRGGFSTRLGQVLDLFPQALIKPPLSALAILGPTLFFTVGHNLSAWPAAILYFLFTSWVYQKTRSFRICIIIHAFANLSIALLVLWLPDMRYLW
jgi:uncharacterized protein